MASPICVTTPAMLVTQDTLATVDMSVVAAPANYRP